MPLSLQQSSGDRFPERSIIPFWWRCERTDSCMLINYKTCCIWRRNDYIVACKTRNLHLLLLLKLPRHDHLAGTLGDEIHRNIVFTSFPPQRVRIFLRASIFHKLIGLLGNRQGVEVLLQFHNVLAFRVYFCEDSESGTSEQTRRHTIRAPTCPGHCGSVIKVMPSDVSANPSE